MASFWVQIGCGLGVPKSLMWAAIATVKRLFFIGFWVTYVECSKLYGRGLFLAMARLSFCSWAPGNAAVVGIINSACITPSHSKPGELVGCWFAVGLGFKFG